MKNYSNDNRVVLTLDAGGQNLDFCAIKGYNIVAGPITIPSEGDNLERCLKNIIGGFKALCSELKMDPDAISFAFPGPTDYPNGIIGDLKNLPGFRGGVALKALLEDEFKVPVFINNDADLFTYGEAIVGFLPKINNILKECGSVKQYKNLLGVTLGTGFGGGVVCDGQLFVGDNSAGAEVWILRNKKYPHSFAEESISARAIIRVYRGYAKGDVPADISPKVIAEIARGQRDGDRDAAIKSYCEFGEVLGDAIANAVTIVDGLVVIGGKIAGAADLFMPAVIDELNGKIQTLSGNYYDRLEMRAFNLEDSVDMQAFCRGEQCEIKVPFSKKVIKYDPMKRIGVGIAVMDTTKSVGVGAYHFAIAKLDKLNKI